MSNTNLISDVTDEDLIQDVKPRDLLVDPDVPPPSGNNNFIFLDGNNFICLSGDNLVFIT